MPRIGLWEIGVIFLIILIIFGPGRLPLLGKGLGEFFRNLKKGVKEVEKDPDSMKPKVLS